MSKQIPEIKTHQRATEVRPKAQNDNDGTIIIATQKNNLEVIFIAE